MEPPFACFTCVICIYREYRFKSKTLPDCFSSSQDKHKKERKGQDPIFWKKKCCKHSRAVISEFDHWLSMSWLAVDVRFMCTEALKSSDAVLPRQEMKSTGNDDFQLDLHEDQKVALMFCKLFGFILKKRDFIFGKF